MVESKDYPYFNMIINSLNGFQQKKISTFLDEQNEDYFEFAEKLSSIIHKIQLSMDQDITVAADAYRQMCRDMLKEQIRFKKTGVYSNMNIRAVVDTVYNDSRVMRNYMLALLMTYFLWPNQYKIFQFYKETLHDKAIRHYLEVGAGHGLFTSEAAVQNVLANLMIIDISDASLHLCGELLEISGGCKRGISFVNKDFLMIGDSDSSYDFITMGEVLEHVANPKNFLDKAHNLLNHQGSLFLSTCVNCPAIDHIYHFRSVPEIQKMIEHSNFKIMKELILPVEDVLEQMWESEMTGINYAAILAK